MTRAEQWRDLARGWRRIGEIDRANLCEQMADYWAMPLWKRLWRVGNAARLWNQLYEAHSL